MFLFGWLVFVWFWCWVCCYCCFWGYFYGKNQPSQIYPIYITAEVCTLAALKPATPCYINVLNIAFQNQFLVSLATQAAKSSPAWCSAACMSFQVNQKSFGLVFRTFLWPVQATGEGDSSFAYGLMRAIISMVIIGIYNQSTKRSFWEKKIFMSEEQFILFPPTMTIEQSILILKQFFLI